MKRPWLDNALDRWQQAWSVRRVLFTAGIVAAAATGVALALPVWLAPVLAALLLLTLLLSWFRRPFWLVCVVAASLFLSSTAAYRYNHIRPLSELSGRTDTLTGQVIAVPAGGSMYTLRVTDSACVPKGTRVALYCPTELAPNLYDTVEARVELLSAEDATFRYAATDTHLFAFLENEDEDHIRVDDPEGFLCYTALLLCGSGFRALCGRCCPAKKAPSSPPSAWVFAQISPLPPPPLSATAD